MFDNFWNKFYEIFVTDKGYLVMLSGLRETVIIALGALIIGVILGTLLSSIKVTPKKGIFTRVLHVIADAYITVIRGTPVMVQLLLAYFGFMAGSGIDALYIAIGVFGINSGAYVAEIIRGGILAVDKGQMEAGRSLALSYPATMIKIILPQAIKNILPALGNEFIVLIKETSVAGFITVFDLTQAAGSLQAKYYDAFVPYLVLAAVYLVIVMIATKLVNLLEKELRKSDTR